ncbi:hypothetical protein FQA47_014273 [Oryzias melastigma]|uniref:Uncharacterized protein n=1 Tax=Oryzias melastigma TaxID=30732 RepID=A0A834FJI1_ORYME|nr:hypothetical protein FQA47_014273 [Oryzias melastigma]
MEPSRMDKSTQKSPNGEQRSILPQQRHYREFLLIQQSCRRMEESEIQPVNIGRAPSWSDGALQPQLGGHVAVYGNVLRQHVCSFCSVRESLHARSRTNKSPRRVLGRLFAAPSSPKLHFPSSAAPRAMRSRASGHRGAAGGGRGLMLEV